jgi:hypothetical protein
MYEDTIIEISPDQIARTLIIKVLDGRYEAHQDGHLFAAWPDEISARVQLLAFEFNNFRVVWP